MAFSNAVSLSTITETEYFSFFIDYAVKQNFSVALWRLPNDSKIQLVISKRPEILKYTATLEGLLSGFIVAPFEAAADRIYLKADYSFSFSNGQLNEATKSLEILSNVWLTDLVSNKIEARTKPQVHFNTASSASTTDMDFFLQLVRAGVHEIEQGSFEKVVLSRTLAVELTDSFDISVAFQKL